MTEEGAGVQDLCVSGFPLCSNVWSGDALRLIPRRIRHVPVLVGAGLRAGPNGWCRDTRGNRAGIEGSGQAQGPVPTKNTRESSVG